MIFIFINIENYFIFILNIMKNYSSISLIIMLIVFVFANKAYSQNSLIIKQVTNNKDNKLCIVGLSSNEQISINMDNQFERGYSNQLTGFGKGRSNYLNQQEVEQLPAMKQKDYIAVIIFFVGIISLLFILIKFTSRNIDTSIDL